MWLPCVHFTWGGHHDVQRVCPLSLSCPSCNGHACRLLDHLLSDLLVLSRLRWLCLDPLACKLAEPRARACLTVCQTAEWPSTQLPSSQTCIPQPRLCMHQGTMGAPASPWHTQSVSLTFLHIPAPPQPHPCPLGRLSLPSHPPPPPTASMGRPQLPYLLCLQG